MKRLALFLTTLLGGCSGDLAALNPVGPAAAAIKQLTLIFIGTSVAVYALTVLVFFLAVRRGTIMARAEPHGVTTDPGPERGKVMLVAAAVALTVVVLSVLVGVSAWTDRRLIAIGGKPAAEIDITARPGGGRFVTTPRRRAKASSPPTSFTSRPANRCRSP